MVKQINLPAVHITTTKSITIEADHDLLQQLEAYQQLYAEVHGGQAALNILVREMARGFMEQDEAFQKYRRRGSRRRHRRSSAATTGADNRKNLFAKTERESS